MQVTVDKRLGDQTALGVDNLLGVGLQILFDRSDFSALNGDADEFCAFTRLCVFDQDVVTHDFLPLYYFHTMTDRIPFYQTAQAAPPKRKT